MSKGQHHQANRHWKGSRGGRLLSKLGTGGRRRTPLWKLRQQLLKPSAVGLLVWLGLVGLSGCATPQQRQRVRDWQTICGEAPYGAGQEVTAKEQRAMQRIDPEWKISLSEWNRQCQMR